jgi:hypothetical protein
LPAQIVFTMLNVGITFGKTVIVFEAVAKHPTPVAVKIYVPVVVLLTVAGFHVPVKPLVEVVGKIGAVAPLQIGAIAANVAVIVGLTVTDNVVVIAHWPALGVKV